MSLAKSGSSSVAAAWAVSFVFNSAMRLLLPGYANPDEYFLKVTPGFLEVALLEGLLALSHILSTSLF